MLACHVGACHRPHCRKLLLWLRSIDLSIFSDQANDSFFLILWLISKNSEDARTQDLAHQQNCCQKAEQNGNNFSLFKLPPPPKKKTQGVWKPACWRGWREQYFSKIPTGEAVELPPSSVPLCARHTPHTKTQAQRPERNAHVHTERHYVSLYRSFTGNTPAHIPMVDVGGKPTCRQTQPLILPYRRKRRMPPVATDGGGVRRPRFARLPIFFRRAISCWWSFCSLSPILKAAGTVFFPTWLMDCQLKYHHFCSHWPELKGDREKEQTWHKFSQHWGTALNSNRFIRILNRTSWRRVNLTGSQAWNTAGPKTRNE